jgi:hypothetical protein
MVGRDDDTVRFSIDPRLQASSMKAPPDSRVPAKSVTRDRSFEITGGVSYPNATVPSALATTVPASMESIVAKVTRNPAPTSPDQALPDRGPGRVRADAMRMQRSRQRRRDGYRYIALELHESEIDALVEQKYLLADQRHDREAIVDAVYSFLEEKL